MRINESLNRPIRLGVLAALVLFSAGCGSSPESDGWKTRRIKEDGTASGIPRGDVLVGPPKELPAAVRVSMVDALGQSRECRVVVIDGEGHMHVGDKTTKVLPGGTCRSTALVFSGVKLKDIRELRFQERPFRKRTARGGGNSAQVNAAPRN